MKTIKLKEKKFISWKIGIVFILLICSSFIFLKLTHNFTIGYKYYLVEDNNEKTLLGFSKNKNIVDETIFNYITYLTTNNIIIYEYNLEKYIDKKIAIGRKSNINDKQLTTKIQNNISITASGVHVQVAETDMYILDKDWNNVWYTLKQKNIIFNSQDIYTNLYNFAQQNDIDKLLNIAA